MATFGTGVDIDLALGSDFTSEFVSAGVAGSIGAIGLGVGGEDFIGAALRAGCSWGKRERIDDGNFSRTILVGFDGLLVRAADAGVETFDKELDARRGGFAGLEEPPMTYLESVSCKNSGISCNKSPWLPLLFGGCCVLLDFLSGSQAGL